LVYVTAFLHQREGCFVLHVPGAMDYSYGNFRITKSNVGINNMDFYGKVNKSRLFDLDIKVS